MRSPTTILQSCIHMKCHSNVKFKFKQNKANIKKSEEKRSAQFETLIQESSILLIRPMLLRVPRSFIELCEVKGSQSRQILFRNNLVHFCAQNIIIFIGQRYCQFVFFRNCQIHPGFLIDRLICQ